MLQDNKILLVTLNVADLQHLITNVVRVELENFKNLIHPKISKLNDSDIISRKDVSELLKVSYCSLYHWNLKGILKAKKIANRVYYSKSEVFEKLNAEA